MDASRSEGFGVSPQMRKIWLFGTLFAKFHTLEGVSPDVEPTGRQTKIYECGGGGWWVGMLFKRATTLKTAAPGILLNGTLPI